MSLATTKPCTICGIERDLEDYHRNRNGHDGRDSRCKPCRNKTTREWMRANKDDQREKALVRRRAKQRYVQERKAVPCADCGQTFPSVAMHFHHVRGKKVMSVARLVDCNSKLETIQEEIDKCEVLCANCHAVRHRSTDN